MVWRKRLHARNLEMLLLLVVGVIAFMGPTLAEAAFQLQQDADP